MSSMNLGITFEVAVPTFILLVLGISCTIYEFHQDNKKMKNKTKNKK